MDQTPGKSITIVNRHYPPIAGVTGEAARELAVHLTEVEGLSVNVVHVRGKYFGKSVMEGVGSTFSIKPIYNGRVKLFRLIGNLYEGYRLINKAKQLKSSHVIVMTDPPLLAMWASLLLRKKHDWILWSMDVYPQAFIANNLISDRNWIYRKVKSLTYKHAPNSLIALGPEQKQYLAKNYNKKLSGVILPCGIYSENGHQQTPDWKKTEGLIYFGYCGNLGEAHSPDFLEAFINRLDPQKHRLILSTYGSKSARIKTIAENHPAIESVQYVRRTELRFIDIHLVTLLEEWTHVCVPSKAVSAVCAGSAMLFCGAEFGDTWKMLGEAGWRIDHLDNMEADIDAFLRSINKETLIQRKAIAQELAKELLIVQKTAYSAISQLLHQTDD